MRPSPLLPHGSAPIPPADRSSQTLTSFGSASVFRLLIAIITILVIASTAGQISRYVLGHGRLFGLVRLFYLDGEQSIPAYYSSLQLLAAAAILGWISRAKRRSGDAFAGHWMFLALGFAFLSIDENCSIHEMLSLENALHVKSTGFTFFAWVIPAGIGVVTLALLFLRFLLHLPAPVRNSFLLGAALYLGGAVGVEMFGGRYAERHGFENLGYVAHVTLEEILEMVGIALFIRSLLRYAETTYGGIFLITGPRSANVSTPP
jgi:hypothetical protein